MNISALYKIFINYPFISTDSRNIIPGSVFFSLKGKTYNGNSFAPEALNNGCSYAVIDDRKYAVDDRYILVENTLKSLQQLARYHRENLEIPVLAITGTNGKTTTKELIKTVLEQKFAVKANEGNLNNHIGVPLSVLSIDKKTEIGIIEMGANHQGEIRDLCEIAMPDYGLITNIGSAHLEGFGSLGNIIKTKAELFDYLSASKANVFVNSENKLLMDLLKKYTLDRITYGTSIKSDCYAEFLSSDPFLGINWTSKGKNLKINTRLVGKYNFENVLAAICVGSYFGINQEKIVKAIGDYLPLNNRSQYVTTSTNKLVLDAYNANPTSMKTVIENFSDIKASHKVLILGDMLELGDHSLSEHKKVIQLILEKELEQVFLVGDNFSKVTEDTPYNSFSNTNDFIKWLKLNKIKNSYILLKGSRGMSLEKIVEYL